MKSLTRMALLAGLVLGFAAVAVADGYLPEQHRGPRVKAPLPQEERTGPAPHGDGKGVDAPPENGPPARPEPDAGDTPDPEPPAPPEPPEEDGGQAQGRDEGAGERDGGTVGDEPPPPSPPDPPHT